MAKNCEDKKCPKSLSAKYVHLSQALQCLNTEECEQLDNILQMIDSKLCDLQTVEIDSIRVILNNAIECGDITIPEGSTVEEAFIILVTYLCNQTFCNIELDQVEKFELSGNPIEFTKTNFGSEVDAIVPGLIEITRGVEQGLYNTITELGFNDPPNFPLVSPEGTVWNSVFSDPVNNGHGDITNLDIRTYTDFVSALDEAIGFNILSTPLIMYIPSTNQYFKFTFTSWTSGGAGGGYSYIREEIIVNELCTITFSDGSKLNSASGLVTSISEALNVTEIVNLDGTTTYQLELLLQDENTWDMTGVAFVDPVNGDNFNAVIGDGNKPYRSLTSAMNSSANIIYLKPGTYFGSVNIENGKIMYAAPGVIFGSGFSFRDLASTGKTFTLLGHAVFASFSGGFDFNTDCKVFAEFDKMDNCRTVAIMAGTAQLTMVCNSILCNGVNGAAISTTSRDSSVLRMKIRDFFYGQHRLVYARQGAYAFNGEIYIECPDMRIIPHYTSNYGNTGRSVFNIDQSDGCKMTIIGNVLDENPVDVGVNGGILNLSNQFSPNKIIMKGRFETLLNKIIYTHQTARHSNIHIEGELIHKGNNTSSINLSQSGSTTGSMQVLFKNCVLQINDVNISVAKTVYFMDCTFFSNNAGLGLIRKIVTPGDANKLYFHNCIMQHSHTVTVEGFTTDTVGFTNTYANVANDGGIVDTYGGFTVIPNLETPNIY